MKIETPGTPVLLHSCCAPCSGAILECLLENRIRPTVFFSNSNIFPQREYELRKAEIMRYCGSLGVECIEDDYDHSDWLACVRGLEKEPERGERCTACFRFRLLRAAEYASSNGYGVLATTLASSRWKDLGQVNAALEWACARVEGVSPWIQNWRKGGLQPRRNEIIREQNFYNQTFCGCEFQKNEKDSVIHD